RSPPAPSNPTRDGSPRLRAFPDPSSARTRMALRATCSTLPAKGGMPHSDQRWNDGIAIGEHAELQRPRREEEPEVMTTQRKRLGVTIGALAAVAFAVVATIGAGGASAKQSVSLPRSETLYMSGNQWSPNNDANPAKSWDYVTGLVGFAYETPFRYDPLKDKWIPWLATGGNWTTPTTYVMDIRSGVKWSDGQPMTPQDVAYSFNLLKVKTHPQHA